MRSILVAFALLFSLLHVSPATANECGGNLIAHMPMKNDSGRKIGEVALYYNSTNGNNCAVFNHAGPTWGVPMLTGVALYVCPNTPTNYCAVSPSVRDEGRYAYRAGPIRIYGRGRCIMAQGRLEHRAVGTSMHCR